SRPSLSRPIEFKRPEAVSTVRGGGFPMRGRGVIVLGMIAPRRAKGTKAAISRAYPNVPDATRIGLASLRRLSSTFSVGTNFRGKRYRRSLIESYLSRRHGATHVCTAPNHCARPLSAGSRRLTVQTQSDPALPIRSRRRMCGTAFLYRACRETRRAP